MVCVYVSFTIVLFCFVYVYRSKNVLIEKLARVIGLHVDHFKDPDPSYVITVDNIMKMLAILMRFRYVFIYYCHKGVTLLVVGYLL